MEENLQENIIETSEPAFLDPNCMSPDMIGYYQDDMERIVWIENEIDEWITEVSKRIIRWNIEDNRYDIPLNERIPIKIFINSCGGLLEETMALVGVCSVSKTPIWTINAGNAYSAAGLILMAGHRRFAIPFTQCMIHDGTAYDFGGEYKSIQSSVKNYKVLIENMKDYITQRTYIARQVLDEKINTDTDWYFTTSDMVKYGIVNKIVDDIAEIV